MIFYHISDTLQLGETMSQDYKKTMELVATFSTIITNYEKVVPFQIASLHKWLYNTDKACRNQL